MTDLAINPLYIIKANGHGWKDRFWVETIDPNTDVVTGPMNLTGLEVTGTFTRTDDGSAIAITEIAGITIVSDPGGEFTAGLTWAQLTPFPIDGQVIFRFTVWNDDLPVLNTSLVYTIKAG